MFQKGCGIGIPADPFRNSGLDGAAVDFWDHNPISNEMSASVFESSGRVQRDQDRLAQSRLRGPIPRSAGTVND